MVDLSISIPKGFLEEEIRCGYKVTREIKEVWAVELDLLHQVDIVCKIYNLHFVAGAGTLLGAVRHKGFIPWDDDIDIYMLRPDYDKLINLTEEFKKPYFLQTAYSDPGLIRTFARLRNSQTTFSTDWEMDYSINKGIFIDIFPLDGISDSLFKDRMQKILCHFYRISFTEVKKHNPDWTFHRKVIEFLKRMIFDFTGKNKVKNFGQYELQLKKYSTKDTKMWGNRTLVFDCPKSRRPYEDWLDIIDVPFEFTRIPIPRNYDEILKQQYGEYMRFPSNKNEGKKHQIVEISTDYTYDDPRRLTEK